MALGEYKPSLIPVFIRAKSEVDLVNKMLKNNTVNQRGFNYMPPVKDGSDWVVWYYADVFNHQHVDNVSIKEINDLEESE